MTYKITLRVYQTNADAWFHIVEKSVRWGGTWSEVNGQHVLTMPESGTSGTLRFFSEDTEEHFLVVVGVHNYRRWTDIVPDLAIGETGAWVNPHYYGGGPRAHGTWEQTLTTHEAHNARGRRLAVTWTAGEGNDLKANICVG